MARDAVLSMLSLAMKAGKLKSGEFAVEKAIKEGKARLVLMAKDASERTKKTYRDRCQYYDVSLWEYADKAVLGAAIGKDFRAGIAVCDEQFAKSIEERLAAV